MQGRNQEKGEPKCKRKSLKSAPATRAPDAGTRRRDQAVGQPRRPRGPRPEARRPLAPGWSRARNERPGDRRTQEEGVTVAMIESIEKFPGENGGHRVVHNFRRETGKRGGAMSGGIYMERPKPEEHPFGASEGSKVLRTSPRLIPCLDIA